MKIKENNNILAASRIKSLKIFRTIASQNKWLIRQIK